MPYKDPEQRREYHRNYIKEWNKKNIEKRRKITRESMQKWREADPERAAKKMREYRKKNNKKYEAEYKKRYPEKAKAHGLVLVAKKAGKIIQQPCEVCGNERSQAHHEDYSRPFKIIWLCQKHHSAVHKKHYG